MIASKTKPAIVLKTKPIIVAIIKHTIASKTKLAIALKIKSITFIDLMVIKSKLLINISRKWENYI